MNFLDSIKRQEEEKHRISGWSRAVTEMSRFIRRHLRQAEAQSPLTVRPDLIRLDGIFFVRLTVLFDGRTVTITPLSLAATHTPYHGGCVAMRSTGGNRYDLLWNGVSPSAPENWTITNVEGSGANDDSVPLPLTEASLDDALNQLFGLVGRGDGSAVASESARLLRSEAPIVFATPKLQSAAIGASASLLD
ncbi:MAG TPA: hypothetical protein VJ718_08710, partial [Candidatus Binataceae bacterium]|nr:hypothetical protein [Candidatus Binataceae bacterium]